MSSTPRARFMLSVTLTPEEYEQVKQAAAMAGQSIHAFNQRAIRDRAAAVIAAEQKDPQ